MLYSRPVIWQPEYNFYNIMRYFNTLLGNKLLNVRDIYVFPISERYWKTKKIRVNYCIGCSSFKIETFKL